MTNTSERDRLKAHLAQALPWASQVNSAIAAALLDNYCQMAATQQDQHEDSLGVVKLFRANQQVFSSKPSNVVINLGQLMAATPAAVLTAAGATQSKEMMVLAALTLLYELHGLSRTTLTEPQAAILVSLKPGEKLPSRQLYDIVIGRGSFPQAPNLSVSDHELCLQFLSRIDAISIKNDLVELIEDVRVY
jgi:hypothetical protein